MEQIPSLEANFAYLVKKLSAFFGTRSFITVFTKARFSPYPQMLFQYPFMLKKCKDKVVHVLN